MESPHPLTPAAPVPSRRSLVPVVLLGSVLTGLVAVIVLVVMVLNRPGSAGDVAQDFVVATYEGDLARACELITPELAAVEFDRYGVDNCGDLLEAAAADTPLGGADAADTEILEVQENGDTATARISSPTGSAGVWVAVSLVREDDRWLVSGFSG